MGVHDGTFNERFELFFAERIVIARGEYGYHASRWTQAFYAYNRGEDQRFVVLLAGVDDTLDDQKPMQAWLPDRPALILRPRDRSVAIRLAVEDANNWREHVRVRLETFPRRDIKDLVLMTKEGGALMPTVRP